MTSWDGLGATISDAQDSGAEGFLRRSSSALARRLSPGNHRSPIEPTLSRRTNTTGPCDLPPCTSPSSCLHGWSGTGQSILLRNASHPVPPSRGQVGTGFHERSPGPHYDNEARWGTLWRDSMLTVLWRASHRRGLRLGGPEGTEQPASAAPPSQDVRSGRGQPPLRSEAVPTADRTKQRGGARPVPTMG
jgi:hypothetical protein